MKLDKSNEYLARAEKVIPALSQTFSKAPYSFVKGVYPVYLKSGKGSHVTDVDGNEFIDYVLGLGPVGLGYCYEPVDRAIVKQLTNGITFSLPHYLEVEFSEKLQQIIPHAEMIRFAKTGSDAVTACVRAARAYTKRDHILYTGHGGVWHDWFCGITSRNEGVPAFNNDLLHLFKYNDIEDLKKAFQRHDGKVAAVVMEPMWLDYPEEGYLEELKEVAHKNGALVVFDEVLTGFRLANGGAQELFKFDADMAAFGKAIGNGVPLGAITGKEEYMKKFYEIFYSTTYGGETLSLAAGIAVTDEYLTKDVISHSWKMGKMLKDGINGLGKEIGVAVEWLGTPVRGAITFSETKGYKHRILRSLFMQECVKRGVLFGPGETLISYSHSEGDLKKTLDASRAALEVVKKALDSSAVEKALEGEEMKTVLTF
ncbi:MAG: aminotransferase class III-fold pyridoxal phosphate-dependent enzyme [Nitrososphaera sp.]